MVDMPHMSHFWTKLIKYQLNFSLAATHTAEMLLTAGWKKLPVPFWVDMMQHWCEYNYNNIEDCSDGVHYEIIWFNPNIRVQKNPCPTKTCMIKIIFLWKILGMNAIIFKHSRSLKISTTSTSPTLITMNWYMLFPWNINSKDNNMQIAVLN